METEEKPENKLQALVEAAKNARLSPADEDEAARLLKGALEDGKKGLATALDAIVALPWNVAVKAVGECWPEMKPAARTQFLSAVGKLDSDAARRVRLSLGRGLFAQDAPAAAKLIAGVCELMVAADGGPTARDRQTFGGVLFGKAKPWLLHLPLAEWKSKEAAALIRCALAAGQQCPPFTQVSVLRWIAEAGKLAELPDDQIETLAKSITRWQPRWQKELKKAVPELPKAIEEALAQPAPAPAQAPRPEARHEPPRESPRTEPRARTQTAAPQAPRRSAQPAESFDFSRSLREIESYVGKLRAELQQARAAANDREPRRGRSAPRAAEPDAGDVESLRRHNAQLHETVEDLRHQLEELASDHEDRASVLDGSDALQQFKTLLGMKLGKDFADFAVLRDKPATEVVRRHLGGLLDHIFEVLKANGVAFTDAG